jgi:hypothetical protein
MLCGVYMIHNIFSDAFQSVGRNQMKNVGIKGHKTTTRLWEREPDGGQKQAIWFLLQHGYSWHAGWMFAWWFSSVSFRYTYIKVCNPKRWNAIHDLAVSALVDCESKLFHRFCRVRLLPPARGIQPWTMHTKGIRRISVKIKAVNLMVSINMVENSDEWLSYSMWAWGLLPAGERRTRSRVVNVLVPMNDSMRHTPK